MDIGQLLLSQPVSEIDIPAPNASAAAQGTKAEQLEAAARQFEGIFIHQILKQMQESVQESSFDPEDGSNEQVHGLYCTFLADAISQRGGVGLWEKIYEQMNRLVEPAAGSKVDTGA